MKAARKKRRSRIVPRAIFATVCIGVVPEIGASCSLGYVAEACFTAAGEPCGEDAGVPDAGPPDAGRPDGGHGDGG